MLNMQFMFEDCHIEAIRNDDDSFWTVILSAEGFETIEFKWNDETFGKILFLAISGGEGIPADYEAQLYRELEPLFARIPDIYRLIP